MNNPEWTELILKPGRDWDKTKKDSPVVKITVGAGEHAYSWFGVLGTLVEKDGIAYVAGIDNEVSENGSHSCLLGDVSVDELKSGEIELPRDRVMWRVEFAGLASSPQHKNRNWSYWF